MVENGEYMDIIGNRRKAFPLSEVGGRRVYMQLLGKINHNFKRKPILSYSLIKTLF